MSPSEPRVLHRRRPYDATAPSAAMYGGSFAYDEMVEELPDDDLAEVLEDTFEKHRTGDEPDVDEAEYLAMVQEAVDGLPREG
ncbi:hypothetical protein [Streptomyces sp. TR06-5]|uniref:hypothetical protein n=1 Tax=unclassified Streptomyces TaxID=2593676 RepID=UPI0039A1528C